MTMDGQNTDFTHVSHHGVPLGGALGSGAAQGGASMSESFERMLRFAAMDFNKFWVEVRSFPVLLDTLKGASIQELDSVLQWLKAAPAWHTKIRNPKLVFELSQPESRRRLLEFARDVQCLRMLREAMAPLQLEPPRELAPLNSQYHALDEAAILVEQQSVSDWKLATADEALLQVEQKHADIFNLRGFFLELSDATGAPMPAHSGEAARFLDALGMLKTLPAEVRPWRLGSVMDPANRVRLLTWRDRAQPVHELRKRLDAQFNLEEPIGAETLRKIAEEIQSAGLLRAFNARYKDALEAYRGLRKLEAGKKKLPKENRREIVEKLEDWAKYLDLVENFDEKFDGHKLFGPSFAGIATDFDSALAANRWASEATAALGSDEFGEKLAKFALGLPEDSLVRVFELLERHDLEALHVGIGKLNCGEEDSWEDLEQERGLRLQSLTRLVGIARAAGFRADLPFAKLLELRGLTEESLFLLSRMESNTELRSALRAEYAAAETDLTQIEQSLAYVKFIHASPIRDELKMVFLSAHGVLRLADARTTACRPMPSLAGVHEHVRKLEEALEGKLSVGETPLEPFIVKIQEAVRQKRTDVLFG